MAFRNINVSPDAPVSEWGFEGMLAAVDRRGIADWRRIAAAVLADPRGEVADTLIEVFEVAEDSGVVGSLRRVLEIARERQDRADRTAVADRLSELMRRSGLDQGAFARRLGTSRSRLSTYLNGHTVPSALVLVRAERIAGPPEM